MEEKTKQNLEQALNDCLDRAWACSADSEDYTKYLQKANSIGALLNESDKIEANREVELKKIEASQEISKKDLFVVGAPIAAGGIGWMMKERFVWLYTKAICKFEETNTFVSTGGRAVTGIIRNIFRF